MSAGNTVVLLGAGASVGAGIPTTARLTHQVVEACIAKPLERAREREKELDAERSTVAERMNLGDPRARVEWEQKWTKPQDPIAPVRRADALALVYSRLRSRAAADIGQLEPVVDLEDLVTVLDELVERQNLAIAPFVSGWDPQLLEVDHLSPGPRLETEVTTFDRRLVNFIENVLENRLKPGKGHAFAGARKRILTELPLHLEVAPASVDYLRPLVDWAAGEAPGCIATLNHDRTIETACKDAGIPFDTGLSRWDDERELSWTGTGVRLLKLHGSIPGEGWIEARETFLFGGRNKLTADGPYIELIAEFRRWMLRASRVVVIGYSFRDEHINACIERAIEQRGARGLTTEMLVIDPNYRGPDDRPPWRPTRVRPLGVEIPAHFPDRERDRWKGFSIAVHDRSAEEFLAAGGLIS